MLQTARRSSGGKASSRPATLAGWVRCSSLPTRLRRPSLKASRTACRWLVAALRLPRRAWLVLLGVQRGLAGRVFGRLPAQALAQARAQVLQDGRLPLGIDLLPQRVAAFAVQALDQRGDLGRVQARHELAHTLVAPLGQRLDDVLAVGDGAAQGVGRRGCGVFVFMGCTLRVPSAGRCGSGLRRLPTALTVDRSHGGWPQRLSIATGSTASASAKPKTRA